MKSFLLSLLLTTLALPAMAQSRIGAAESASGDVTGTLGGRRGAIAPGSTLFQQQVIETAAQASAGLRFNDATSLAVGPSARVALDRFVFNPDGGARAAALDMARGSFRFVTGGKSPPSAFKLQSPHATLGLRGTEFTVEVDPAGSNVRLHGGEVRVCKRRGARECAVLDQPGQAVRVTFSSIEVLSASVTPVAPQTPGFGFGKGKGKGKAPF